MKSTMKHASQETSAYIILALGLLFIVSLRILYHSPLIILHQPISLFLKSRARRSSPYLLCMMISVQVGSRQVGSWSVRKSKTESQLQPRLSLVQLPSSPYSHPRPSSLWFSEGIIILSYYVQSLFLISPWVNAWFYWSVYQNQERNETLIRLVTDVSPLSFLFFLFPLPTPPQKKKFIFILFIFGHIYKNLNHMNTNFKRPGWISITFLPVILITSMKNTPLGIFGKGYERINFIHRFTGRCGF